MSLTKKGLSPNQQNRTVKKSQKTSSNLVAKGFFIGTKKILPTEIITNMKSGFTNYSEEKRQADAGQRDVIVFNDIFELNQPIPSGQEAIDIITSAKARNTLDRLISYSFYIMQPTLFVDTANNVSTIDKFMETLKYQMGKDIRRDKRTINGKIYDKSYYQDFGTNYEVADDLYNIIIDLYSTLGLPRIDYNIINKMLLLSCQNVFNLTDNLLSSKINETISPETSGSLQPKKNIVITITKERQIMEFNFETQLIISRPGEGMDPEYPCGNFVSKILVDLKNNTYSLAEFKLNYNLDNCGPKVVTQQPEIEIEEEQDSNFKYKAAAAALGTGLIIATPFLIGAIGGNKKTKRNRRMRNKTKRRKPKTRKPRHI